MATRPVIQVNNLPSPSEETLSATISPARGKEMRANLLQRLRPPPLVHVWEFWHDRQDRKPTVGHVTDAKAESANYEDRLVKMATVTDVREFWELFNNFDVMKLPLRDSVHLFHKGVKPLWEDPRNERGGAWTFRVPKDRAKDFWKEICMMAIGEQLQEGVASKRTTFLDDICGVSFSVRFTSININIWNRDGNHENGINKVLEVVLANLPPELAPKESSYYYKKHSDHAGFSSMKESRNNTNVVSNGTAVHAVQPKIVVDDDAKSPTNKS